MILNDSTRNELSKKFGFMLDVYVQKYKVMKKDVAETLGFHPTYFSMINNQIQWPKLPVRVWETLNDIIESSPTLSGYIKENEEKLRQIKSQLKPSPIKGRELKKSAAGEKPQPVEKVITGDSNDYFRIKSIIDKGELSQEELRDLVSYIGTRALSQSVKLNLELDLTVKINGKEIS